jgi:leucyl aminopeptidase
MKIDVVNEKPDSFSTDLLVVGVFSPALLPSFLESIDEKLNGVISQIFRSGEFSGEWQQFRLISTLGKIPAKNILLLGLGKKELANMELLRKAAGFSVKIVRDFCGIVDFATTLHLSDLGSKEECSQAVSEGSVLGSYQFIKYKTIDKEKIKSINSITLLGEDISLNVKKGFILSESANYVKDLVNEPGSNMKPETLALEALKLKKLGVKVTVFDKKAIEKLGLSALLAVNRGSVNEPRFVVMEYDGLSSGNKGKKIAIVGKGITFDSGGLDIKNDESMLTMKNDMAGAATVIGVMKSCALLKSNVHLFGVFAATENMPGNDAYKPGDIVKTYSGKTIEVANTDAEGRVILSDALAYTDLVIKPDYIIDLATLTGACVVALGNVCAGVMGNDDSLIDSLLLSGQFTGERLWKLPLFQDYRDQVKSEVADVRNLGLYKRSAGAITAAAFLNAFVNNSRWAHIDIAGTAWSDFDFDYIKKGGTGFGVRVLFHAIENLK